MQQENSTIRNRPKRITNSKPIPHIPLPFKEVIADVLKVKPPEKRKTKSKKTVTLSDNDDNSYAWQVPNLSSVQCSSGSRYSTVRIFRPTRRILRFIRDLEAVQIATELFELVIVLMLVGLIFRRIFPALRGGCASSRSGSRDSTIRKAEGKGSFSLLHEDLQVDCNSLALKRLWLLAFRACSLSLFP